MAGVLQAKWIPAADFRRGRAGKKIECVILHSTCGRKLGDIPTLTEAGGPAVSCHYYITQTGELYQFVKETDVAFHTGTVRNPAWGNSRTIGIEMEHFDPDELHPRGEDWPGKQVIIAAKLCGYLRQKYGQIPIKSHAEICAPKGRKSDPAAFPWIEFSLLVSAAMRVNWTMEVR